MNFLPQDLEQWEHKLTRKVANTISDNTWEIWPWNLTNLLNDICKSRRKYKNRNVSFLQKWVVGNSQCMVELNENTMICYLLKKEKKRGNKIVSRTLQQIIDGQHKQIHRQIHADIKKIKFFVAYISFFRAMSSSYLSITHVICNVKLASKNSNNSTTPSLKAIVESATDCLIPS